MGILKDRIVFIASEARPSISHPCPTPFTPNPPLYERPVTPDWTTLGKESGFRRWINSKSRLFWVALGLSFLLIVGVATAVPLYLITHKTPSPPVLQVSQASQSPTTQDRAIAHSYLVDIQTAEDEPTRAAVISLNNFVDSRIEMQSSQNWIFQAFNTR